MLKNLELKFDNVNLPIFTKDAKFMIFVGEEFKIFLIELERSFEE